MPYGETDCQAEADGGSGSVSWFQRCKNGDTSQLSFLTRRNEDNWDVSLFLKHAHVKLTHYPDGYAS